MVRVAPHRRVSFEENKYMLFNATQDIQQDTGNIITTLGPIHFPYSIARGCEWRTDGDPSPEIVVRTSRESSRHGTVIYDTRMQKTQNYIKVYGYPEIYEYTVKDANKVLPSSYYRTASGNDTLAAYHFIRSETGLVPVVASAHASVGGPLKIPTHMVRAFMDAAIGRGDECPVSMEPLAADTIACTPCGHLFAKAALARSLNSSNTCPTCRASVTYAQNYFY